MNLDDFQRLEQISQKLFKLNKHTTEYFSFRNYWASQFKQLIELRARPYQKFPNYPDLIQEGFIAFSLAEKNYRTKKGSFTYWADWYISTRIKRKANRHSLVKLPLKKAKKLSKTYSIISLPISSNFLENLFISSSSSSSSSSEDILNQKEKIKLLKQAIQGLTSFEQKLIKQAYQFDNISSSLKTLSKDFNLTIPQIKKSLSDIKLKLRNNLLEIV